MHQPPYIFVNREQGTPAWLEWRNQGIGSSDAPIIMGENPWKDASQLLLEKCHGKDNESSPAMTRGSALEPEARRNFENKVGIEFVPRCLQSLRHEWLRASVDGLSLDGNAVVEIKCGESVYRKTVCTRTVPQCYFGQLQHILAVTHLDAIGFWCYLPNRPSAHLTVARDEGYIERLLKTEELFWNKLVEMRKPMANSKDLALDFVCRRLPSSIELVPVENLPAPV